MHFHSFHFFADVFTCVIKQNTQWPTKNCFKEGLTVQCMYRALEVGSVRFFRLSNCLLFFASRIINDFVPLLFILSITPKGNIVYFRHMKCVMLVLLSTVMGWNLA